MATAVPAERAGVPSKVLRLQVRNLWKHPILLLLGWKSSPHPRASLALVSPSGIWGHLWELEFISLSGSLSDQGDHILDGLLKR